MTPSERRLFLEKFAAEQHTAAEHWAFVQWLRQASDQEMTAALEDYERLYSPKRPAAPTPQLMAKIEARLDQSAPRAAASLPVTRPLWPRIFAAAAAVVAVLVLLGGDFLIRTKPFKAVPLVYLHKRVPAGHTDSLTLADGSVVVLNERSTFTYPAQFAAHRRDVYLEGEAYFRVTKNPRRPFVIHSGSLQTRVVGTSFNVYAYPRAARQEVTVLTGKVVVSHPFDSQKVNLLPAQHAVFDRASRSLRAAVVGNPALSLAWRRGQLRFEDAPLDEVLDKLSIRYGVAIRARAPRLHRCRVTVRFGTESVAEVVQVLAALTHSRPRTDSQHTIWLEGPGSS
ncbi:FecR family protein [Hymenobacter sp. BT491]|uniref:FecR family protein n=1 Tax=Hymenobacter sp. BT491 TaxID=2766779 RepID=UPI001653A2FD|nr:FecR domain-containing protein [Hymenobacter sp. BT491]MBC6991212.1 FecR domain-containing protein [Hymenobacter sp. BT491]